MIHPNYPAPAEVDAWCDAILRRAEAVTEAPVVRQWGFGNEPHVCARGNAREGLLEFPSAQGGRFWCYWQPAQTGPAPVVFHLPGYGAEFQAHPELVAAGFNVLHINPLGYNTPFGWPPEVEKNNPLATVRPVFPDTVRSLGERGYVDWLTDAAVAVRWARSQSEVQAERFAFFGTSQGGGTALLLGSIHAGEGCRAVAADQPFMIGFPKLMELEIVDGWIRGILNEVPENDRPRAWRALGLIDTLNHLHRLTMPVYLGAGTADIAIAPEAVEPLFQALPGTRCYAVLRDQPHGYTNYFKQMAAAWFRCYV